MDHTNIIKEITPLTQSDCFTMFSRIKKEFDFPLHYHDEYELNLIINGKGARRIIGNHIETIDELELVLVGPNLPHAWFTHQCQSEEIQEITVQWHKDLFDEKFLKRNQLNFIKKMFELSSKGLSFSKEAIEMIAPRIKDLDKKSGFDSVISLMLILRDLSSSRGVQTLSGDNFIQVDNFSYNSRRLDKAFEYMNAHYGKPISLKEIAKLVNMTEVSFSRFIKKRTGNTFIDSLTEIRLGHATRLLIETTHAVAEVSFTCGFNNISNFNRIFKKKKGCTPTEFRENFSGSRIFV
ncbi:helix-turn-helix domain-containing protein [Sphingobacterium faecium]|uniref:helix-turn-helix domain-containing protein n=1 Tax=Sphingobacterium faecium TaxID=34087 RepID=UPI003DA6B692